MKNKALLILSVLLLSISFSFGQQRVEHVLRKYKNDANVTSLDMAGDFRNMVEDGELESEIEIMNVLVFSKNENVSDKDLGKIKNILATQGYEPLINVKNKDAKFKIQVIESGDFISDLFAEVDALDYKAYITIRGKVKYEELSKFNFDFTGSEVFQQLKD